MQVYLAASWSRKTEIQGIAEELIALGINVHARWLFEPHTREAGCTEAQFLCERAEMDVADVRDCDVLVRFSDDLSGLTVPAQLATGARMFEMALAREVGSRVLVVGGHQCIFDWLPDIVHVSNTIELQNLLVLMKNNHDSPF